ncbi:MAG: hypothetical protein Q8M02_09170 [Candidatus Didemnitutus sp.]|nr:hypothetical protein [Candidatus Didemnitutus sp.]
MKKPTRRPSPDARTPAKSASHLVGLGLDHTDGHKRLTTAEKFTIVGGSEETHGRMAETVIKTFEELKQRGEQLETVRPQELVEIIHKSTPR